MTKGCINSILQLFTHIQFIESAVNRTYAWATMSVLSFFILRKSFVIPYCVSWKSLRFFGDNVSVLASSDLVRILIVSCWMVLISFLFESFLLLYSDCCRSLYARLRCFHTSWFDVEDVNSKLPNVHDFEIYFVVMRFFVCETCRNLCQ